MAKTIHAMFEKRTLAKRFANDASYAAKARYRLAPFIGRRQQAR